jgi:hypothetical protein
MKRHADAQIIHRKCTAMVIPFSYQTQLRPKLYKRNPVTHLAAVVMLCGLLLGFPAFGHAQDGLGARVTALGHSGSALEAGAWSVFANPALLSEDGGELSFYSIRHYGIAELTDMAAAGSMPLGGRRGNIGIGLHSFGFELYRESRFRLAYQNSYAGLEFGLVPGLTHITIENYGSAMAFSLDAGLAYTLIDDVLLFGARATNLNRARLGQAREELPRSLAAGLSYQLAERALLTGELFKDVRFPLSWRGGLEVRLINQLFLRGGITTEPLTYAMGVGYSLSRLSINLAAQQHYALGWSPGLDIGLHW